MGYLRNNYPIMTLPIDAAIGGLVYALLQGVKMLGAKRASNLGAKIAPLFACLPNKTAHENLTIAFPQLKNEEREIIIKGMWENICRTAFEYSCMDDLWDFDPENPMQGNIETDAVPIFMQLKDDGKPALIFSAHLANFELPAVAAHAHGLDATALYRIPNNKFVAKAIFKTRTKTMGKLVAAGRTGVLELARAVESGSHVGMLVDQRLTKGVKVTFFGQTVTANPTIARLARHFDCPVHGVRVIRKSDIKFKLEATEEIILPRDSDNKIDVQASMQMITTIIEGWIKQHPEQWLWLHRRFRI